MLATFNNSCPLTSADEDPDGFDPLLVCNALLTGVVSGGLESSGRSTLNPRAAAGQGDDDIIPLQASSATGPSADGLAIMGAFGYTSFDAYDAWVNSMSPAEFANHAEVLQGVIAELDAAE